VVHSAVDRIVAARRATTPERSVLVALSGIDASGKGHVTAQIVGALQANGVRAAGINIDGWLHLPRVRFSRADPGAHFYRHAIRFDEMFAQLVMPLRAHRSLRIEADYTEETATEYRKHTYAFEDIDVVVLEGIFLLKRAFQRHYDLSFWVDCSFETALERAIARAQEGLSPAETVRAYQTIYFPAQEIHAQLDDPRTSATAIIVNDPRLPDHPETSGAMVIREATLEDARAIATIHVRSWQSAYQGIVPETFLRSLSIDAREARWRTILVESASATYVAEERETMLGWASVGKSRDADAATTTGELWAIYVGPEHWHRGAGRALWERGESRLKASGFHAVVVWVLKDNRRAQRFYEAVGFVLDPGQERLIEIDGTALPEIRFRRALAAD
jgi:uridine kinase